MKKQMPVYATVVIMNGKRWYSSFNSDLNLLIEKTKDMPGIIAIEEAHAGKPPVWEREE